MINIIKVKHNNYHLETIEVIKDKPICTDKEEAQAPMVNK